MFNRSHWLITDCGSIQAKEQDRNVQMITWGYSLCFRQSDPRYVLSLTLSYLEQDNKDKDGKVLSFGFIELVCR